MRVLLLLCLAFAQEDAVETDAAPEEEVPMDAEEQAKELLSKLDQLNELLKERKEKGFPADEKLEGAVEKLHQMLGLTGEDDETAEPMRPKFADSVPIGGNVLNMLGVIGLAVLFIGIGGTIYAVTRPVEAKEKKKKK
jgi:hypothetical protein